MVLGTPLDGRPGAGDMVYYEAPLTHFESADLRINGKTKLGLLVLRARPGAAHRGQDRFPTVRLVDVSPDIPPEGTKALTYAV